MTYECICFCWSSISYGQDLTGLSYWFVFLSRCHWDCWWRKTRFEGPFSSQRLLSHRQRGSLRGKTLLGFPLRPPSTWTYAIASQTGCYQREKSWFVCEERGTPIIYLCSREYYRWDVLLILSASSRGGNWASSAHSDPLSVLSPSSRETSRFLSQATLQSNCSSIAVCFEKHCLTSWTNVDTQFSPSDNENWNCSL